MDHPVKQENLRFDTGLLCDFYVLGILLIELVLLKIASALSIPAQALRCAGSY